VDKNIIFYFKKETDEKRRCYRRETEKETEQCR